MVEFDQSCLFIADDGTHIPLRLFLCERINLFQLCANREGSMLSCKHAVLSESVLTLVQ